MGLSVSKRATGTHLASVRTWDLRMKTATVLKRASQFQSRCLTMWALRQGQVARHQIHLIESEFRPRLCRVWHEGAALGPFAMVLLHLAASVCMHAVGDLPTFAHLALCGLVLTPTGLRRSHILPCPKKSALPLPTLCYCSTHHNSRLELPTNSFT